MSIFGTTRTRCNALLLLFAAVGIVMSGDYREEGYFSAEPILVLGGSCVGAVFCLVYPRRVGLLQTWYNLSAIKKMTTIGGVIGFLGTLIAFPAIHALPQDTDALFVLDLVILLRWPTSLLFGVFGWKPSEYVHQTTTEQVFLFVCVLLVNSLLTSLLGAALGLLVDYARKCLAVSAKHP